MLGIGALGQLPLGGMPRTQAAATKTSPAWRRLASQRSLSEQKLRNLELLEIDDEEALLIMLP